MRCDVKTLYRFCLLVVGCPAQAEAAVQKAASEQNPLPCVWQELSRCTPLRGEQYCKRLCCCGASDRLCDLLCDLYWDERGLLLLKLLFGADKAQLSHITSLPEQRLARLMNEMHTRCDALTSIA